MAQTKTIERQPRKQVGARNAARARRHAALAVRRDLRGALPDAGLRLRQRRAGRGPLQERGSRLPLQPLRQSDRRHVRGAHAAARRRRGGARHGDRHGRRHRRAAVATSRPAITSSPRARCSAPAATSSRTLCPRFGIASTLVDGRDLDAWQKAVRPNTKAVLLRDAVQPDARARRHRRRLARSPTQPARSSSSTTCSRRRCCSGRWQLGADVVVYSATKHIDGQGRCLGGVVLGAQDFVNDHLHDFLRQTGPSLSPFNAWVMLKGLETLPVRVRAQCGDGGDRSPIISPASRTSSACSTAAAPTIRRRTSPSGR